MSWPFKKKTDVGILKGWTQHRSRGEPLAHLANKGLEKKEGDRTSVKIGQVTKLKWFMMRKHFTRQKRQMLEVLPLTSPHEKVFTIKKWKKWTIYKSSDEMQDFVIIVQCSRCMTWQGSTIKSLYKGAGKKISVQPFMAIRKSLFFKDNPNFGCLWSVA